MRNYYEHSERGDKERAIVPWMTVLLLLFQLGIVAFQCFALLRYRTDFEPFMPTMAEKRSNPIEGLFFLGVIFGPFLIQFLLVPLALRLGSRLPEGYRPGLTTLTIILALLAWWLAFQGWMEAFYTFD